jgi:RNA polymerase sigma factor (sigma-70 family)
MSAPGVQIRPAAEYAATEIGMDPRCLAGAEDELDQALHVFLAERTRLLRIAYRVVGDVAGAEDVVQDAWLRWQRVDRRQINNPAAFLTTATTHLAINLIQSARHRHELPTEAPRLILGPTEDPTSQAERTIAIERMLGFLMAKLNASELAALVLRKCFDYPYQDVADVLGTSTANARQLVRRSHLSITSSAVRRVDLEAHRRLVAAFTVAANLGDMESLLTLLGESATRTRRCASPRRASRAGRRSGRPVDQARAEAGVMTKGRNDD